MSIFQECSCICCRDFDGFPILWELPGNKLWFEIPKNGSSSIKRHFGIGVRPSADNGPDVKRHITDYTKYQTMTPYAIMRDPVDRFIGTVKHYFLPEGGRSDKGVEFFKRYGLNIESLSVTHRVEFVIDNLAGLTSDEEVHHFYPQTHFLADAFDDFNLIRMSEISSTFNVDKVRNKTVTKTKITLTPEQELRVKEVYKQDYMFLQQYNFKP